MVGMRSQMFRQAPGASNLPDGRSCMPTFACWYLDGCQWIAHERNSTDCHWDGNRRGECFITKVLRSIRGLEDWHVYSQRL